jgi:hypothetical protein
MSVINSSNLNTNLTTIVIIQIPMNSNHISIKADKKIENLTFFQLIFLFKVSRYTLLNSPESESVLYLNTVSKWLNQKL